MATKQEVLKSFVEWTRSTREARDRAIEAEENEARKRLIRQIYNVKMTTIAECATAVSKINTDKKPPKPISEIPGGGRH